MNLEPNELHTVIAGLRYYQSSLEGRPMLAQDLEEVATNGGEYQALTVPQIDDLVEKVIDDLFPDGAENILREAFGPDDGVTLTPEQEALLDDAMRDQRPAENFGFREEDIPY